MGQLIDSSVFIGLERRKLPLVALAKILPDEPMALAAVTASELLVGVHRADSAARSQKRSAFVEAILAHVPVIAFDLRLARMHAQLVASLAAQGQLIGAHDLQIAATALAVGSMVVTDNVRQFGRIQGLQVLQPDWRSS